MPCAFVPFHLTWGLLGAATQRGAGGSGMGGQCPWGAVGGLGGETADAKMAGKTTEKSYRGKKKE